jgi:CheY-like chemotaxis protein
VLVVDDEPDAVGLVETILAARGARVTTAASVREALEAIRRHPPDVLLSDVAMPGEDGYALIHALRRSEAAGVRSLPAAAITAYAAANDRARTLTAGFQAHLAKPIEPDALVRVVAQLAGRIVQS